MSERKRENEDQGKEIYIEIKNGSQKEEIREEEKVKGE